MSRRKRPSAELADAAIRLAEAVPASYVTREDDCLCVACRRPEVWDNTIGSWDIRHTLDCAWMAYVEANPSHPRFKMLEFGLRDRAGADPAEWPEDLRVREFPEARRG